MTRVAMIQKDPAQALNVNAPVLNGAEVKRSVAFRDELTQSALRDSRFSVLEILFPSNLTKEVRAAERDIVVSKLRTQEQLVRLLDEAGLTIVQSALEQVVRNGKIGGLAFSAKRLLAERQSLEEDLSVTWRAFCEGAVADQEWAERMPPAYRALAMKRVEESLEGFYSMMSTLLREFEATAGEKVGRP